MTRFSRAALIVFDFVDQIGQLAFIANIHLSKQYKYLLGHQKTPTFTTFMKVATTHALTDEKIRTFPKLEHKANHAP